MGQEEGACQSDERQFYSPASQIGSKDRSVAWYDKTLSGVPADARDLLERYSKVPPDEVEPHVLSMRDKAWDVYPYPCIGQFKFLALRLYDQPSYATVVRRLKQGAKYLDIGCCLGQDIRKLAMDGAPPENLYGAELRAPFVDLGYELFRDRGLAATFMEADALVISEDSPLSELKGEIDFVHLGMVLHVFGRERQRALLENCISLLRPERGSAVLGTAVGAVDGTQAPAGHYLHSDETFRSLWAEISERKGVRFDCRASLDDGLAILESKEKTGFDKARRLIFEVERL
ncbi:putative methyltransferase domain-containing protein [Diaporthe ampelina]|uniref:Putative methyltransferase domain-containing protein n=1 Tax=Diaporthe ampelina TaxID=1214573 RepID=A0A0G2HV60_9PEZI|nr:putative methyltransferase domain-containing protein [Diaporthe ampelina]